VTAPPTVITGTAPMSPGNPVLGPTGQWQLQFAQGYGQYTV
jgi:hypothetical protein